VAITTPASVRARIGLAEDEVPEEVLDEFIADQQAYLELATRRTYAEGDPGFRVARCVVRDLVAVLALVRLTQQATTSPEYKLGKLDVTKKNQLARRLQLIEELKDEAARGLEVLARSGQRRRFVLINGPDSR
jgi:hypothetical protein